MMSKHFRALRLAALALLPLAAACEAENPNQVRISERLVMTVNSTVASVTLADVDAADAASRTVPLGSAQMSPTGLSARGRWAVVPLGTYPFAAVVDLRAGALAHTVALPAGSGATGSTFVNDTLAVVANPGRNTVSPVNVARGTAGAEVAVGVYPQAVASDGSRVYVVNANLVNFAPAGTGSVTVLDASLGFVRTAQLSGVNPAAAAIHGGRLYVLHSGTFGGNDGSLSVVDLQTLAEVSHHTGFGEFPSSLAVSPSGQLYVGLFGEGIVVWNPATAAFVRGFADAIRPAGGPTVSGIGFDHAGRLHAVAPGTCMAPAPGALHRLGADGAVLRTVATGTCAFGIAFADVPEED
jgi:hypothetical protein